MLVLVCLPSVGGSASRLRQSPAPGAPALRGMVEDLRRMAADANNPHASPQHSAKSSPEVSKGDYSDGTRGTASKPDALQTFTGFYSSHVTGRGMWKWQNALQAYQRHWAPLAGRSVRIAEVGVQSGGSMLMWRAAFGSACHIYGLDINPKCLAFQDASTTITIGDQGDYTMWQGFFSSVCSSLDILVDDGGHQPQQMFTTLTSVLPRLNPGGYVAIEDIHGPRYLKSFFQPAAQYLADHWSQVASIHVYPFLLIVKKPGQSQNLPATELSFRGAGLTVRSFEALWRELRNPWNRGGHVVLENSDGGHFFSAQGLTNVFVLFNDLHASSWTSVPAGCAKTAQAICTNTVINNNMQNLVSGYHVYPTKIVVEIAQSAPTIKAERKGTEWIGYS